jgi:hypothetical protein
MLSITAPSSSHVDVAGQRVVGIFRAEHEVAARDDDLNLGRDTELEDVELRRAREL